VRGGTAAVLRDEVNRLEAIAGAGDPTTALARAASVVRAAGLEAKQVALLTDGQRTEWQRTPSIADAQVLVYVPTTRPPANRAVTLAEARPARWTPPVARATTPIRAAARPGQAEPVSGIRDEIADTQTDAGTPAGSLPRPGLRWGGAPCIRRLLAP